jgi:hypothetical protein
MNDAIVGLPALVDRAADALTGARSSAEVLEARDLASVAYAAAKTAGRFARAKKAHDDLIAAVYRAQANALEIESRAKMRLADEYDAAQERGEVKSPGNTSGKSNIPDANNTPTVTDLGLDSKQIHEARRIRDMELLEPGFLRDALQDVLGEGREPTRAALQEIISAHMALPKSQRRGLSRRGRRPNPFYEPDPQFDAMLVVVGSCRNIVERGMQFSCEYIIGGCLDDDMRERNLATIRTCRDFLTQILEVADVE